MKRGGVVVEESREGVSVSFGLVAETACVPTTVEDPAVAFSYTPSLANVNAGLFAAKQVVRTQAVGPFKLTLEMGSFRNEALRMAGCVNAATGLELVDLSCCFWRRALFPPPSSTPPFLRFLVSRGLHSWHPW